MIYTIGRQYGSGGKAVGEHIAKTLDIPFYDKEILAEAAKDSDYSAQILESLDEQPVSSLLYSMSIGTTNIFDVSSTMPLSVQAFLAQIKTIQRLASENESCVFVGRCADYALRERNDLVSAFILSDDESRIATIVKRDGVTADKAAALMKRIDKNRSSYYNYYTEEKWGAAYNYDICIDSSIGIEGSAEIIIRYGEMKNKNNA